jgi:hypothetical protein
VALAALAVGAMAGWFAAGAWGKCKCENVEVCKYGNMEAANAGKPSAPNGRAVSMKPPKEKAKPRRKTEANVEKQREPEVVKQEEKPAQAEQAEKKNDNPFPRYLDMFRNDPEALAAEFLKEAEEDRAFQAKRRQEAIDKLNLNAEQAAVFEKTLDELRDEITRQTEERVNLIKNGQLNEETATDGRIWESNMLVAQEMVAAREAAVRETAERLYEQLELDGVSDDDKQKTLYWSAYTTSFSYECLEPNLDVYDKVYKNMGVGKGIFSWCVRPHPEGKK